MGVPASRTAAFQALKIVDGRHEERVYRVNEGLGHSAPPNGISFEPARGRSSSSKAIPIACIFFLTGIPRMTPELA
jgi:hypothetical protein